jgi:hypothetical protein
MSHLVLQGKVLGGWFFFHIITQLLAILAAAGGVVIALLAFGWKDVPGLKLYLPHKWTGLGVMGMALLQLLFAPLRPRLGSKPRSCWTFVHSSWGSLTILAGCGNTILGALLLHDFKGEPYLHWLVPCLVVIGFMGLVALLLEAFKLQVGRYDVMGGSGHQGPLEQPDRHRSADSGMQLSSDTICT